MLFGFFIIGVYSQLNSPKVDLPVSHCGSVKSDVIWLHRSCLLTHWGRVTHICVSKLTIIGSDNGLSPGRRQAIILTNAGMLLIGALGTNVSEVLIKICTFSLKKMVLKMSSGKRRPSCLSLNVLTLVYLTHWPLEIWFCSGHNALNNVFRSCSFRSSRLQDFGKPMVCEMECPSIATHQTREAPAGVTVPYKGSYGGSQLFEAHMGCCVQLV